MSGKTPGWGHGKPVRDGRDTPRTSTSKRPRLSLAGKRRARRDRGKTGPDGSGTAGEKGARRFGRRKGESTRPSRAERREARKESPEKRRARLDRLAGMDRPDKKAPTGKRGRNKPLTTADGVPIDDAGFPSAVPLDPPKKRAPTLDDAPLDDLDPPPAAKAKPEPRDAPQARPKWDAAEKASKTSTSSNNGKGGAHVSTVVIKDPLNNRYLHMIDTSTPRTAAETYRGAASAARADARSHQSKADNFRLQAAALERSKQGSNVADQAAAFRREAAKAETDRDNANGLAGTFDGQADAWASRGAKTG